MSFKKCFDVEIVLSLSSYQNLDATAHSRSTTQTLTQTAYDCKLSQDLIYFNH